MNTIASLSRWVLIAALSLLLVGPGIAQAEPWTSVGAAGTVDDDDLALYETATSSGLMSFNSGVTGTLNVKYNIVAVDAFDADTLTARFRDNGGSAQVIVELRRYNIFSGTTSAPLQTINSNSFASSSSFQTQSACFAHNFDFNNFAYFINAIITKTVEAGTPALGAIRLGIGNCVP